MCSDRIHFEPGFIAIKIVLVVKDCAPMPLMVTFNYFDPLCWNEEGKKEKEFFV